MDDLHDLLARREALPHVLAERALAHVRDELLDDAEVDVGLEQGEPDLAHGAGDRLLVEDAAPAEVAQGALELFAERVEHRRARVPGRSLRFAAVRGAFVSIAAVAALLLAGCGGSGGSNSTTQQQRLTPALYRAQIAIVKREAAKAQSDVSQGLGAKNVPELKQRIDAFAAATQHIADKVASLNPPQNAEAANTQLAQGLHAIAAGTRAARARRSRTLKSVGAAIAYLEHSKGPVKGSREVVQGSRDAAEARCTTTARRRRSARP